MIRMDDVTVVKDGEKEDGYTNYKVRAVKYFEHPIHYTDVDWMVKTELEDLLQRVVVSTGHNFYTEDSEEDLAEALKILIAYYNKIVSYDD